MENDARPYQSNCNEVICLGDKAWLIACCCWDVHMDHLHPYVYRKQYEGALKAKN